MSAIGARAKELVALGWGINDAGQQAWYEYYRAQLDNPDVDLRAIVGALLDQLRPPLNERGTPERVYPSL